MRTRLLLTLGLVVATALWLGHRPHDRGFTAQAATASCGGENRDWSDPRAFAPGCIELGAPPRETPPPPGTQPGWGSDATKQFYNYALGLEWSQPMGDWVDGKGVRGGRYSFANSPGVGEVGVLSFKVPIADMRLVYNRVLPGVGTVLCDGKPPLAQARIDPSTEMPWNGKLPDSRKTILVRCPAPGTLSIEITKMWSGSAGGSFEVYQNDPHPAAVDATGLPPADGTAADIVLDLRAKGWHVDYNRSPNETVQPNGMLLATVPVKGATGASGHFLIPPAQRRETLFARTVMRVGNDWPATTGGKYPGLANTGQSVHSGGVAGWGGRLADGTHWSARTNRSNPEPGPWTAHWQGWGTYVYRVNHKTINGDVTWSNHALPKGEFVVMDQMVKLNTFGSDGKPKDDGELAYWLNGELAVHMRGIIFRDHDGPDTLPETYWMDVYIGGVGYEAPYPHTVLFADVQVSTKRLPFDAALLTRLNAHTRQQGREGSR